jgi:hypothetical protein
VDEVDLHLRSPRTIAASRGEVTPPASTREVGAQHRDAEAILDRDHRAEHDHRRERHDRVERLVGASTCAPARPAGSGPRDDQLAAARDEVTGSVIR